MELETELPFPGALARVDGGDYLSPLLRLRAAREGYLSSRVWRTDFLDILATLSSFVGDHAEALRVFDLRSPPQPAPPPDGHPLDGAEACDAVEAIVEAARTRRAVFVNEAHHVAPHRALTLRLLRPLYEAGYRWLALEAVLREGTEELNGRGYPTLGAGLYTREPLFGELVREALRLGYRVVAYEAEGLSIERGGDPVRRAAARDLAQAENLRARVLDVDPDARLLVHAGYGHVFKRHTAEWAPMAARFAELTGIDPFTVDQTLMTERSAPEHEHPVYRHAVAAGRLQSGPTVFRGADGGFVVEKYGVDAQVFHPRTTYDGGRPDWLRLGGRRQPAAVFGEIPPGAAPHLLQAFHAGEGADAVPVDQVVAEDGPPPPLVLPTGTFRLRALDATGAVVHESVAEVR